MEVYHADLRKWPLDVALKALDRWPEQSQWWPPWHELQQMLGEIKGIVQAQLPPPEHEQGDGPIPPDIMFKRTTVPFPYKLAWDELVRAIDEVQKSGRNQAWLRQALMIYDAQLPYARGRGWT